MGHGAVRPGRIWLASDGTARLATFPLIRDPLTIIGARVTLDLEEAAVDYCAPECTGGEPANIMSDLYSLGCVLYEMLAGRVPFPTGDREQRLEQHRTATAQPLDEINPAVPKKLAQLVAILLSKKPDDRKAMPFLLKEFGAGSNSGRVPEARVQLDAWLTEHGQGQAPAISDAAVVPMLFNPHESTAPPGATRPKRAARGRMPVIAGIVAAVSLIAAGITFYLASGTQAPRSLAPTPSGSPPGETADALPGEGMPSEGAAPDEQLADAHVPATAPDAETPSPGDVSEAITALDGTMWASPTQGAPLDLKYLAPGAEVIVALRPAQFAAHPETEKLLDPRTLGMLSEFVAQQLPALAGALSAKSTQP